MKRLPQIALIGRTNVGKSTLFNALCGAQTAIVEDFEGVTRDRHFGVMRKGEFAAEVIDCGGLVGEQNKDFEDEVKRQVEFSIQDADVVVALFDGLHGPHPDDPGVVDRLRTVEKPVLWVVNKCEKPVTEENAVEFYGIGIPEYRCISAAHRHGVQELKADIVRHLEQFADTASDEGEENDSIRVAIIGKPNVGKSTLVNKLLGADRLITSPIAGTTRDSIDVPVTREGQRYVLVDTAGLRRKSNIEPNSLERHSTIRSLRSIARADVCVVVLDATEKEPSDQDIRIATLCHERGIPLVLAVNKWDAIEKDHRTVKEYKDSYSRAFRFCTYAPIVFLSALNGRRVPNILDQSKAVYLASGERIQTAKLNQVLERAVERKPPPVYRGGPVKLFFATQVSSRPPTILTFWNHPRSVSLTYRRYLLAQLRKEFPFPGTSIRLFVRKRTEKSNRQITGSHAAEG
ncbi:MAG: ribosome biogenesis GTPase Der [Bdellovibrionales bacterium]|nr:ribosome biogenesis GTPase Der [Bdellovibrionales bacterium]